MTRAQIRFFATRSDLVRLLQVIEENQPIKYVRFGSMKTNAESSFSTVTALPNLGRASHESAINCDTFLICPKTYVVRSRKIAQRYVFDQLLNPDTVTFTPGGIWAESILLHGRFATAAGGDFASRLMQQLTSAIRRQFRKVRAFYVGNEAEAMLDQGKRLTIAAQAPRALDLSRVNQRKPNSSSS